MRKAMAFCLALALTFGLTACGTKTAAPPESETAGESAVPRESESGRKEEEQKKPLGGGLSGGRQLPQGVYIAGDDLRAGQYRLTCVEADYSSMHVVLFEDKTAYENYQKTQRSTGGEEMRAIEKYALAEYYLKEEETGYVGLHTGIVLMLENGKARLAEWSGIGKGTDTPFSDSAAMIGAGVFVAGRDIREGQYTLTCVDSDWSMEVDLFESVERYEAYHRSSRYTNGEEADAIEQNAFSSDYIGKGKSCYLDLRSGSVLMLKNGVGTLADMNGTDELNSAAVSEALPLYPGVYFIGTDLEPGVYAALCTKTGWSSQITVYANRDDYLAYMQTERSTNGEEIAAVEQHAFSDCYLSEGEACCMNLLDGMVLVVSDGSGEIRTIDPSWAN